MSAEHPIITVTGSSGAGTTTVKSIFELIFRRENIAAAYIQGDAFHRYDRIAMNARIAEEEARGNKNFSHFNPDANELGLLAEVLEEYSRTGRGRTRSYIHDDQEAKQFGQPVGTFSPWRALEYSDLLMYEGLHGCAVTETANLARLGDLKIGIVPVVNLEWIQKIFRDRNCRGYSTEAVMDTILRRMPDYVRYITPQFSKTHINVQRVPIVDTSNPFTVRWIPTPDETMLVIRFANPRGTDFPYLLSMIGDSFMTRPNTIVMPGNSFSLALQLIITPLIQRLVERKHSAGRGD